MALIKWGRQLGRSLVGFSHMSPWMTAEGIFFGKCGVDELIASLRFARHPSQGAALWADRRVFCSKPVMVMGPTPPGTGVIAPATSFASSKATSPVRR